MKNKLLYLSLILLFFTFSFKQTFSASAIIKGNALSQTEARIENKSKNKKQNKSESVIPIAMAADNNYIYPTIVAMISILENKNPNEHMEFYIMTPGNVSQENKDNLTKLQNIYPECRVTLINMENRFSSAYIRSGHITIPTYYRLCLPSLLPNCDKVLYLDGDIIVNKDLSDLYNTNIDEYFIGGVKDFGLISWGPGYAKKLGLKNRYNYINAGILLMNLKKMREENTERAFLDFIPNLKIRGLVLNDQDVLNHVCQDKIKFLHPKYNAMQHFCFNYNNFKTLFNTYDPYQWVEACNAPTIIHFSGSVKPWSSSNVRYYSIWNKYRQIAENKIYKSLSEGIYIIHSSISNEKVLDVKNAQVRNGANIQLWKKNGTEAQKFKIKYLSQGYYEIESLCSGKVLDVEYAGKTSGTNVWQWSKNSSNAQMWKLKSMGDDCFYLESKCNGLFLTIKDSGNAVVCNFDGTKSQIFKFEKV